MKYIIFEVVQIQLAEICGGEGERVHGCVVRATGDRHNKVDMIYIDVALTGDDAACVIHHEKAHLPPNNWVHP